jgi:hypothetical protein
VAVTTAGCIQLTAAGYGAATLAAVSVAVITMAADIEHPPAFSKTTK